MRIFLASIVVYVVLFGFVSTVRATESLVVSEIAYDIIGADDNHEWFELYNSTNQPIDLSGWRLRVNSEKTAHGLDFSFEKGSIGGNVVSPGGYAVVADSATTFLLDHPSFSGLVVDSVLSLPNYSASRTDPILIELVDGQGIMVTTSYLPKQTTVSGYTIEKIADQWQDSSQSGGTPGQPPSEPQTYPMTIRLSEIVSNPQGSDTDSEWIELENTGDQPVDLVGWYVADLPTASGATKKHTVTESLVVGPGQFISITLSGSMLNNVDETITLYNPNQAEIESVILSGEAKEDWSYSRQGNDWIWTNQPTPGQANRIMIPTAALPTPSLPSPQQASPLMDASSSVTPRSTSTGVNDKSSASPKATTASVRPTSQASSKASPKPTKSPKATRSVAPPSTLSQIAGISKGPEPYRLGKKEVVVITALLVLTLIGTIAYRFRLHHWLIRRFRYGILKKNE